MVPGILPMNMAGISTAWPAFKAASGVGLTTTSLYVKVVILPANAISKKHLAARAGFMKFWPRPPYNCFTTIIAKIPPSTGIHSGMPGGMLSARIIPVTRALPSLIVTGFPMSVSYTYSLSTQESTVARITSAAFIPN